MNSKLLQLEDYGLTDLAIKWEPIGQNSSETKSTVAIDYLVAYQTDNPLKYKLTLNFRHTIGVSDDKDHLSVQASIVGFFLFPDTMPVAEREKTIRVNGLTILYGALRGLLLPITAAFPLGFRYILPAIDMLETIKAVEESRLSVPKAHEASPASRPTSKKVATTRASKTAKA